MHYHDGPGIATLKIDKHAVRPGCIRDITVFRCSKCGALFTADEDFRDELLDDEGRKAREKEAA